MHHIRRQTFEIKFSSQEKAFGLQTRFTELMNDALLPVIEEVFIQVSLPNVVIRLDTLDINLGEISLDSLEHDLPGILRNKLTDALLAAIGEIRYFPKENNQLIAKEKADTELLIHFLQHGTLPWWASHPRQEDFSLSVLLDQCLASQPALIIAGFQQELKTPEVRLRLTRQFPDELLFKILSTAIPARLPFVKSFLTGLSQLQQSGKLPEITSAVFREMSWEFVWIFVFEQKRTSFEEKEFASGMFTYFSRLLDLPVPQLLLTVTVSSGSQKQTSTEQGVVQMMAGKILTEQRLYKPEEFSAYWQQNTYSRLTGAPKEAERFSALIQTAASAQASTIEKLVKQLVQFFEQTAAGAFAHPQTINRVIRETVIHYLFTEKHSTFDSTQYLKSNLPVLVNKLNLSAEQVLVSLTEAGSELQPIRQALGEVIKENPQAFTITPQEKQADKLLVNKNEYTRLLLDGKILPPSRYADLDILRFFLQYGVIPWTERIRHSPDLIVQLLTEMMESQPQQLRQWIQSSGILNQPIAVQRIKAQFSPEMAAWFLDDIIQAAPPQPFLIPIEELTAQPDVLIHYLWAYLETETLPAELPVSISELIHAFITFYPTSSREFISTLPETHQQQLLDSSPELATFIANETHTTSVSMSNKESATEMEVRTELRQSLSEEKPSTNTNARDEFTTTFTERSLTNVAELTSTPEIPAPNQHKTTIPDELTDRTKAEETPEIQTKNLLHIHTSDVSEQPIEWPSETENIISTEPMQPETATSEASPGQTTDKKIDTGKEIKKNEFTIPDLAKKEEQSTNGPEDSYQPGLKNQNQETDSRKPEISHTDALQHISPEEQTTSTAQTDSSPTAEDKPPVEKATTKAPKAAPDGIQTVFPDKQTEQEKKSPGKPIPKKIQESSKRYIWRQPEEPLYIRNAGLVLIHPFLSRFFTMLKLTVNKKFIDELAAQRGVHLLHYISHKSEGAPEYELALNKVLCGLPVSMPLTKEIALTEEEKETCESLIKGVIQNWTILKNTSPDNFRVSFLHREGRLVYTSEDWQLKVENRGYDILIDKLPWAYSIIKLPWMEKVLRVEWR